MASSSDSRLPDCAAPDVGLEARDQRTSGRFGDEQDELDALLKDLPQRGGYSLHSDELRHMPDGNEETAWQNSLKLIERHDRDLCQAYREQIDTLLVFAGLFSAVVTAFAIESYQWLQEDQIETSVELLRDLVVLLSGNGNLTSVTIPPSTTTISDTATIRINVLWFLSLSLSLSAALVAILCKQWLREFERDVGQSPETALAIRHIRFQGLEYWNVGSIVTSVPLMLQFALALFLAGVVDLLWQLHATVAWCVTVVASITLAFYLSTTFLPVIQYARICIKCCADATRSGEYWVHGAFTEPQCAFKSAQAWLALRVFQRAIDHAFNTYASCFTLDYPPEFYPLSLPSADSWVTFDLNWMKRLEHVHFGSKSAFQALAWLAAHLEDLHSSSWILHCVWGRWLRNTATPTSNGVACRDIAGVARAYPAFMDVGLHQSADIRTQSMIFRCSLRTDLPADVSVEFILRIAPEIGVASRWTREALSTLLQVKRGLRIRLGDDVSMGLFRLAELLTSSIIEGRVAPDVEDAPDAVYSFYFVVFLTFRGSRVYDLLIPAMSALALRWFSDKPFGAYATILGRIIVCVLAHYQIPGRDRLRRLPGIQFTTGLCRIFAETWSDSSAFLTSGGHHVRIFEDLVYISLELEADLPAVTSFPADPHVTSETGMFPHQAALNQPIHNRGSCHSTDAQRCAQETDSNSSAHVLDSPIAEG